ncbi:MAG: hypothetical protein AAF870_08330 [Pseudomonadota bacterium]
MAFAIKRFGAIAKSKAIWQAPFDHETNFPFFLTTPVKKFDPIAKPKLVRRFANMPNVSTIFYCYIPMD